MEWLQEVWSTSWDWMKERETLFTWIGILSLLTIVISAIGVPIVVMLLALLAPALAPALTVLAILTAAPGLWIERWLFFAEARHLSMLYYPAATPDERQPA